MKLFSTLVLVLSASALVACGSSTLGGGNGSGGNAGGGGAGTTTGEGGATLVCDPSECGPQLGMPNYTCPDGSIAGPTGQCLASPGGACGWEVRTCPEATLCNGEPNPMSCAGIGCPSGYTCVADPDPTTCHSSDCSCTKDGWICTADCGTNGSSCVAGGAVSCSGATGSTFPSFGKACAADNDCVVKFHQINCCGTRIALGIAVSSSSDFDAAEATCESQYPKCGCAQMPTKAEDGQTSNNEADIQVFCSTQGQCSSFVP